MQYALDDFGDEAPAAAAPAAAAEASPARGEPKPKKAKPALTAERGHHLSTTTQEVRLKGSILAWDDAFLTEHKDKCMY